MNNEDNAIPEMLRLESLLHGASVFDIFSVRTQRLKSSEGGEGVPR